MSFIRAATFLLAVAGLCRGQDVSTYRFLSRPDINAPILFVSTYNAALAAPGYLFLTPNSPANPNFTVGPAIYNNQGALVWTGYKAVAAGHKTFDMQVCTYQNSDHLCLTQFDGGVTGGEGVGSYSQIMDPNYSVVQTLMPSGTYEGQDLTQDLHEFNMVDGGASALLTSYITVQRTFTYPECPGSPTIDYATTGLFSEVTTDGQNTTLFQWASIDHVTPPDYTYTCPGDENAGDGTSFGNGFDYFHINSIDKDADGDYIVSGRHVWTLFKIAGLNSPSGEAPGTVIWRLGGKHSSFPTMNSQVANAPNLNFSWQHHVRWDSSINGVTVWDNAYDGVHNASALASSGLTITIENDNTATLIDQYISPERELDTSQGTHQILPNGNSFCDMGSVSRIFEYTNNGELAFNAQFGESPTQSYRGFRYEWTGTPPTSEIALFSYAQKCGATMAFHSSWNGATEVATWVYYTSGQQNGNFVRAGSQTKDYHFETTGTGSFGLYTYAVALNSAGSVLGRTPVVKTFVPGGSLAAQCSDVSCPQGTNYDTASQATCSGADASALSNAPAINASAISISEDMQQERRSSPRSVRLEKRA